MDVLMSLFDGTVNWLANGLLDASWWQIVLYTLAFTHVTIASVTIFLHRSQAHRALDLHPAVMHFFRLWLWLGTGMVTKEWVAIHRKHHAKCETVDDPHSPQTHGIKKVLLEGSELYRSEAKNQETLSKYGHGTPDDWIERNLYSRFSWQGVGLTLIIDLLLFGAAGAAVWAVQMLWIPITAAGIINGLGHWWGYRNFEAPDASTNISPWGIIIGGEELHNNHHTYPTSAKLSVKKGEFDNGRVYIRALELLGLAHRVGLGFLRCDAHRVAARGSGLPSAVTAFGSVALPSEISPVGADGVSAVFGCWFGALCCAMASPAISDPARSPTTTH
jgi:stearoyl-CoA desaturase (delta-9 desaturase)